jgi:hypothetical protein
MPVRIKIMQSSVVPLHENLGEDYRDNWDEAVCGCCDEQGTG